MDNQRRELEQIAERRGWAVAEVYEDFGISGAKGRDKRSAPVILVCQCSTAEG
jgi:DNA invertase Pin-like site-specific DNA recombinase